MDISVSNERPTPSVVTALFGPDLFRTDEQTAARLASDMRRIPELRNAWTPGMGAHVFGPDTSVGTYDSHMKGVPFAESLAETRALEDFPDLPLVVDAPRRRGFVARGTALLRAMTEAIPVPATPFWHGVAEQTYGYAWCLVDNNLLCRECVRGSCSVSLFDSFADYYHFCEQLPETLDITAQRVVEYINHVHRDHEPDGQERKIMDAWLASTQAIYLDILHPKADRLRTLDDEQRTIRYRGINAAIRALALQARHEQGPLIGDDDAVDAVALAAVVTHDACDRRHDNLANEFYNVFTIVSAHHGVESVDVVRRFCVDVWAWAIDHGADWAIHIAGRLLVWQVYMARYQADVLLDHLTAPDPRGRASVDPYADPVLNNLNPLRPSSTPDDYDLRSRCQDKTRYDRMLRACLTHFRGCPGCRGYDTATWQQRAPLIEAAYRAKYTDCRCLNMLSIYTILALLDRLWWAADPAARYTGPTGNWSPMLC
ncbi:hypothetical protein [Streptomyces sp. SID3343]|uniref:hypothetical protein n=1 Tax=Streptomyces sp. SID3343 TaxID=2690260 RepID=UPI001369235B|nr:hypothetical protein [Streptomyces sp. SID3343]MYV97072.1 hypothetical protein [Streptomyces sp. SID3343]